MSNYSCRVQCNLPVLFVKKLDKYCARYNVRRSDVIKLALMAYLDAALVKEGR